MLKILTIGQSTSHSGVQRSRKKTHRVATVGFWSLKTQLA